MKGEEERGQKRKKLWYFCPRPNFISPIEDRVGKKGKKEGEKLLHFYLSPFRLEEG